MDTTNYDVRKILDHLMESLQVLTKTNRVVGEPIVVGEYTIVPLISVSFGLGGGGGGGEESSRGRAMGSGEGGGAGGSVQPIALLILHKEEIHLYALPAISSFAAVGTAVQDLKKSGLGEFVASIPDMISKLKKKKQEDS